MGFAVRSISIPFCFCLVLRPLEMESTRIFCVIRVMDETFEIFASMNFLCYNGIFELRALFVNVRDSGYAYESVGRSEGRFESA